MVKYTYKKKEKPKANAKPVGSHKMPDGTVMSGKTHSKDSKPVKKETFKFKKKAPAPVKVKFKRKPKKIAPQDVPLLTERKGEKKAVKVSELEP